MRQRTLFDVPEHEEELSASQATGDTRVTPKCDHEAKVKWISLVDSLDDEWIKLPYEIMQSCGQAAQTFGGLLRITNHETFVSASAIAKASQLPVGTFRKHVRILDEAGYINRKGRQQTKYGGLRRTATIEVSKSARKLKPYGFLPLWSCGHLGSRGRLPWSAKAVLSVVMARLCSLKNAANKKSTTMVRNCLNKSKSLGARSVLASA